MNTGEILLYQSSEGSIKIDIRLEEETVWLTQAHMGMLFNKDKRTISEHIGNIFKEDELDEKVVVRKFPITNQHGAIEGKMQEISVKHYNLMCFPIYVNMCKNCTIQQSVNLEYIYSYS